MNISVYHFETPRGVVRVGERRGFVMEISSHLHGETLARRIVVTAACCLPYLPPSNPWSYKGKTFNNLLSLLGETVPSTSAECLFYEPITDITLLGEPDREKYAYEW